MHLILAKYQSIVLPHVFLKGLPCFLLLFDCLDEDSDTILVALLRPVLTRLVLVLVKGANLVWLVGLEERHLVERILFSVAPVKPQSVNDQVLRLQGCRATPTGYVGSFDPMAHLFIDDSFASQAVKVPSVDAFEDVCCALQLRGFAPLDHLKQVVSQELYVSFRLKYDLVKPVHRIGLDQGFSDHQLNRLACLMQVYLPEQFLTTCEHNVDVREDFLVVCNLVVDDSRVLYNPLVAYLRRVYLRVYKVSVKVVKLV